MEGICFITMPEIPLSRCESEQKLGASRLREVDVKDGPPCSSPAKALPSGSPFSCPSLILCRSVPLRQEADHPE